MDSILSLWHNADVYDTTRILTLERGCANLLLTNPDTVFILAQELANLAKVNNNNEWLVRSLSLKARAYSHKFDLENAEKTFREALAILNQTPDANRRRYTVILDELGFIYYRPANLKKMKYYADLELVESQRIEYPKGEGRAYNLLALVAEMKGDTDLAAKYYEQSIERLMHSGDTLSVAVISNNFTGLLVHVQRYEEALRTNERVLELVKKIPNNIQQLGRVYNRYGDIYIAQGNYAMALQQYLNALKLFDDANIVSEKISLYTSLGLLYQKMGEYDNAKKYLTKAYNYYLKADDKYSQVITLVSLGNLLRKENKNGELIGQHFYNAHEIALELANEDLISFTALAIADEKVELGKYSEAEIYLKLGLPVAEKTNYKDELTQAYIVYGKIKKAQQLPQEAIAYLDKANKIALENNFLELQGNIALLRYEIEKENNNTEQALSYYEQYKKLQDTLTILANEREFSKLEAEYNFDLQQIQDSLAYTKKQTAIEQELSVSKSRVRALGLGGLLFLCLSGFIFYLYKRTQKARQLSDKLLVKEKAYTTALEQEQAKVELKSLTKQMDPHFMFNSLQSISHYVSENDKKAANKYLASFAKLMRQSMNYSQMDTIRLADEIEIIRIYLELEVLRFAHAFTFNIISPNNLDTTFIEIPPMLIQPHVENAIWHGLRHRNPQEGGYINLEFNTQNNYLICQITDNGIGRKKSEEINKIERKNHTSVGSINIEKRINLLNKLNEYPINLAITDNEPNATDGNVGIKVMMKLPI